MTLNPRSPRGNGTVGNGTCPTCTGVADAGRRARAWVGPRPAVFISHAKADGIAMAMSLIGVLQQLKTAGRNKVASNISTIPNTSRQGASGDP